eukprot:g4350.t1
MGKRQRHQAGRSPGRHRIGMLFSLLSWFAVGTEAIYAVIDPAAEAPEYCTLYNHQVKSAGTTIKDKLETASLEAGMARPGLCLFGPGHEQSCLEAINGSNPVVVGYTELLRDIMNEWRRECDYFTIMRHPIDRLVSAYFYCPERDPQWRPREWCGQEEQDLVQTQELLVEFAKRNWRNKAFRQMSYNIFPPPNAFRDPTMVAPPQDLDHPAIVKLMPVVQRILASYTAVGILEHWDLSMELFNARIRSPVRDWKVTPVHLAHLGVHRANTGVYSELRQQIRRWARTSPDIHAVLAPDLILYNFAVEIFKQQTAESLGTQWDTF